MTNPGASSQSIPDATVEEMVTELRPEWSVADVTCHAYATDFVATVDVRTPTRRRTVVLKATTSALTESIVARAEPRMLDLVADTTPVPVPEVLAYRDEHARHPAPYYLLSHVPGRNLARHLEEVPWERQKRICRRLGRFLAAIHEIDHPSGYGTVGVRRGELTVLDDDRFDRYADFRPYLRSIGDTYLSELDEGDRFTEFADDPTRFADLVPRIRSYLEDAIPALPDPDPPAYCHNDFRYGNVLIDPVSNEIRSVIDWADVVAADPVYNLAKAEMYLFTRGSSDERRIDELRRAFRESYGEARTAWAIDASTTERLSVYRVVCRLQAMVFLPLWYHSVSQAVRADKAAAHRAFIEDRVS